MNRFFLIISFLLVLAGCNRPYLFYESPPPGQSRERIAVDTVIDLTRAGVSEEIILEKIKQNGLTQPLTQKDVEKLQKMGVSEKVIAYMKKYQPRKKPQRRHYRYYYYPTSSYYFYDCSPHPFFYSYPSYRYRYRHSYRGWRR